MKLVRQLQKSFYQNESPIRPPQPGSTTITDLPLWRVQWTEFPGYQNVLNVHVPHYTNMFLKILNGEEGGGGEGLKHKYFGHVFLPDGSENLDNPEYRLLNKDQQGEGGLTVTTTTTGDETSTKATHIGVLMQISDYKQLEDGRLVLIVQALERFRIVEVERWHSPYAIATVEILPDQELVDTLYDDDDDDNEDFTDDEEEDDDEEDAITLAKAVQEAFQWHPFEVKPVTLKNCAVPPKNEGQEGDEKTNVGSISVSPLVNFDGTFDMSKISSTIRTHHDDDKLSPYARTTIDRIVELEYSVWVQLDTMIKLLQKLIGASDVGQLTSRKKVPVPTQILGLLPRCPPKPWPEDFALEEYSEQMEEGSNNDSGGGAMVGTSSKSPYIRTDDQNSNNVVYPSLRRAQRLSYVIWILTDSLILNEGLDVEDKQDLLEVMSLTERLKLADEKMDRICSIIRQVLNEAQ